MRGFRGLSGVGTREITKERLLRHGSVAISARGKNFQLPEVWPGPPVATPWLRLCIHNHLYLHEFFSRFYFLTPWENLAVLANKKQTKSPKLEWSCPSNLACMNFLS